MIKQKTVLIAWMLIISFLVTACDPAAVAEAAKSYGIAMKEARQEELAQAASEPAPETEAGSTPETEAEVPAAEAVSPAENAEEDDEAGFTRFLDEYVMDMLVSDYTTMHWAYMDPEAAGIDRSAVEVSMGHVEDDKEETLTEIKELRDDLSAFDYEKLNLAQQGIYDQLLFDADITEKMLDDKFDYLDTVWSSNSGIHQILISYFSEYFLYNEQDAEDMILLIRDVPRYVDEVLEYSSKQADAGLLTLKYDLVIEDIDEVLDSRQDSAIVRSYRDSVETLGLPEDRAKAYVDELSEAMDTCFYPSYEKMKAFLTDLNDEGKILPLTSVGALPNGKEYYELLMQQANGSSNTVEEVREILLDQAMEAYLEMQQMLVRNNKLAEMDLEGLKTDFEDIADIIHFNMANYEKEFPGVGSMEFDLSGINDERAGDFSAYFVVPPIDNDHPYQIRYNEREIGTEAETLSMFQTISHEGAPGHMYQAQYNHENLPYAEQFIYSNKAFSEGWATYASIIAMRSLKVQNQQMVRFFNAYMNFIQIYVTVMEMDLNYEGYDIEQLTADYGELFDGEWLDDMFTLLADNRIYYMPYFYGTSMLLSLRSYAESELEDAFDPVEFHNAVLKEGSTIFDVVIKNVEEYVEENRKGSAD